MTETLKLDLAEGEDEEVLAQGRIPLKLKKAVEAQFKNDRGDGKKMNWKKLIESACESYLRQRSKK